MRLTQVTHAGVMELADVLDSKSSGSDTVPVRPRSPAPTKRNPTHRVRFLFVGAACKGRDPGGTNDYGFFGVDLQDGRNKGGEGKLGVIGEKSVAKFCTIAPTDSHSLRRARCEECSFFASWQRTNQENRTRQAEFPEILLARKASIAQARPQNSCGAAAFGNCSVRVALTQRSKA